MLVELMVAIAILLIALFPLISSFIGIHKSVRISYQRAIAMELVDGEMEYLLAGGWRDFKEGTQPYALHGDSVTNLPPGKSVLTLAGNKLRLEWLPDKKDNGGKVMREAVAK
jgi:hypothetical protein